MRLTELVETSERVAERSSRNAKVQRLAKLLERATAEERPIAIAYLCGELTQGRIGIGPATVRDAFPGSAAAAPTLSLSDVDRAFERMSAIEGAGSNSERVRQFRELLERATGAEQDFVARLVLGELRQGAQEGLMVEAVAEAAGVEPGTVRRAAMLSGDLSAVANVAVEGGRAGLERFSVRVFRPVQPMLARTVDDVEIALEALGRAALEYKLDGARVQVHRSGSDVRVYTRRLNEVTGAVPEVVEAVVALPIREAILDGEVLALRPDGAPHSFQTTMRRFGRKLDVKRMREDLPLSSFFFDCLYLDGRELIDDRAEDRFAALADAVPEHLRIPRTVTDDPEAARRFLERSLEAGHEGVMAKALDAPYEAGSRGQSWLKVKPAHTLDLVVLAADWGHGRRKGWLSNLHLGARDPESGNFVMLGKTFKGMTDEMLEWQTERLQELEVRRDGHTVHVRPELVVEVAFDGVQASPQYPGGLALRFARVKRYRPDKGPEEADTIEAVREIYEE